MPDRTTPPVITESLCAAFADAADALALRQASRIAEQSISDFRALGWLDWHGGALRITPLGQMALVRIRARTADAAA